MASLDLQLLDAVVAKLREAGGPTGLTVHESQNRPIDDDQLPSIVVYPFGEAPVEQPEHDEASYLELPLVLECRAKGDPGHRAVDPLYVWAVHQMMIDQQWGGLAEHTHFDGREWAETPSGAVYGRLALRFRIQFWTGEYDVENPPVKADD